MPICAARLPIESPSRPSIVARLAAARRIARRERSPSARGRRVRAAVADESILDKLARSVVLCEKHERSCSLSKGILVMQVTNRVNGVDVDRLVGTIDHISAEPALARFQFRARNQWIDGGHNRTTIKGFYGAGQEDTSRAQPFVVDADEPPVLLGENQAPNAGEYVLHALAACLTGTIVYHAAARGIALDGLECTIEADVDLQGFLGLDETVRPGFEEIRVVFTVAGDLDDEQLAELAGLARYSPVRDIVSNPVPVAIDLARA